MLLTWSICSYMTLTDYTDTVFERQAGSWGIIGCLVLNLVINMSFMVVQTFIAVKTTI